MMSFYIDDEGTKHEVDEDTLQLLKDWINFEILKLAFFGEKAGIPCGVILTLFNLMVEETVAEMIGGIEDEN